jgi:uncharacterized protein YerC
MGYWYRGNNHRRGIQPIPIRWVYVQDLTGTHRDEYFFTTDVQMTPQEIIENYVGRWNLETTFQEMRSYIGLETTHGWSPKTVLRMAPCLFGLYSLTILLYCLLPQSLQNKQRITWTGKTSITFSDVITSVRRWLWLEGVFATPTFREAISKLTQQEQNTLFYALSPAS